MSRIINVIPNDDYTLLIEFEQGSKILFNMQRLIKTIPYSSLKDLNRFKEVKLEDKAICWNSSNASESTIWPLRITIDNILFMLRD